MIRSEELHTRYRLPIRSWEAVTEAIQGHGERISRSEGKLTTLTVMLGALVAENVAIIALVIVFK